jgi:signal transduction histidine kinase/ActR/RegA family two-component response regulator
LIEQRTLTQLDRLPCGWLRLDAHGCLCAVNQTLADFLGHPHDQLHGTPFDRLLSVPSRMLFQSYLQPLLQLAGRVSEIALTLQHAGGQQSECLLYAAPASDDPTQRDLVLVPIRERSRIEAELQRIRRAADQAPGMIFQLLLMADGGFRFDYVSQRVRELYGCTDSQAVHKIEHVLSHIEATDRQRLLEALTSAAREMKSCLVRVTVLRPGGGEPRVHEWQASARPIDDTCVALHGFAADITERRVLEEAAAERAAAQRELQNRSGFLARASHELRTPLNAILGFAQLLNLDDGPQTDPTERRRRIGLIESSGRHMLALVNQMITLARVDHLESLPAAVNLPLSDAVQAAMDAAAPAALAAGVRISQQVTGELQVRAEPTSLRQLLDNLISNGIKYNRQGGEVVVSAAAEQRACRLTISDTGVGLSPEQIGHLFEPFNRLGAPGGMAAGAGLGLVISQQIARSLGAELQVDSWPGGGTRISLALPLGTGRSEAAPDTDAAAAQLPVKGGGTDKPADSQILYIEDDEVNILVMEAIVARRGPTQLIVARSAQEAVEAAARGPFSVALCDLHLPDGDGIALLPTLRAAGLGTETPVILVTASVAEDLALAAEAAGFAEVWTKPLEVPTVLGRLEHWAPSAKG